MILPETSPTILKTDTVVNKALGLLPEPFQTLESKYSLLKTQTQRSQQLASRVAEATINIEIYPKNKEQIITNLSHLLREHINDITLLQFLASCSVDKITGALYFPSSSAKKAA
jgi:glycine cleavage system regulatory protein